MQNYFISKMVKSKLNELLDKTPGSMLHFFFKMRQWPSFHRKVLKSSLWQFIDFKTNESTDNGTISKLKESINLTAARLKTCTVESLFMNLRALYDDAYQASTLGLKDQVLTVIDTFIESLVIFSPLPPSAELFEVIFNFVLLFGYVFAISVDDSRIFVILSAIYDTITERVPVDHFNRAVLILTSLLTTFQSRSDFFYKVLKSRLDLSNCLLPAELPEYFVASSNDLISDFSFDVLQSLGKTAQKWSGPSLLIDFNYFIVILKYLLACENVPDEYFILLSSFYYLLNESTMTESVISLFRTLFSTRKNLIQRFTPTIMTEDLLSSSWFTPLIPVLKLIFQNDQNAYKTAYNQLSPSLQAALDSAVGSEIVEKKRKLIFDLASNTISSGNLTKFEKLDISVLSPDQRDSLVNSLDKVSTNSLLIYSVLASYRKLGSPIPNRILNCCREENVLLCGEDLSQYILMIEREKTKTPKHIKFVVNCLKASPKEELIRRLFVVLPFKAFVTELVKENIQFSVSLFEYLLQSFNKEYFEISYSYLSETQREFLNLLNSD